MAGSGDLAAVLTAVQFFFLACCLAIAFPVWFKPNKKFVPVGVSPLSVVGSVVHFAVKAAVAASFFEYTLNTITDLLQQHHLKKYPDGVDFSKWQTSIWILLLGHLIVFKLADSAYYGRQSIVSGEFDGQRVWASSLYVLITLASTTLTVMFYSSSIWMAGSFHLFIAVVYGVWFFTLNFCMSAKAIKVTERLLGANRSTDGVEVTHRE